MEAKERRLDRRLRLREKRVIDGNEMVVGRGMVVVSEVFKDCGESCQNLLRRKRLMDPTNLQTDNVVTYLWYRIWGKLKSSKLGDRQ